MFLYSCVFVGPHSGLLSFFQHYSVHTTCVHLAYRTPQRHYVDRCHFRNPLSLPCFQFFAVILCITLSEHHLRALDVAAGFFGVSTLFTIIGLGVLIPEGTLGVQSTKPLLPVLAHVLTVLSPDGRCRSALNSPHPSAGSFILYCVAYPRNPSFWPRSSAVSYLRAYASAAGVYKYPPPPLLNLIFPMLFPFLYFCI